MPFCKKKKMKQKNKKKKNKGCWDQIFKRKCISFDFKNKEIILNV